MKGSEAKTMILNITVESIGESKDNILR